MCKMEHFRLTITAMLLIIISVACTNKDPDNNTGNGDDTTIKHVKLEIQNVSIANAINIQIGMHSNKLEPNQIKSSFQINDELTIEYQNTADGNAVSLITAKAEGERANHIFDWKFGEDVFLGSQDVGQVMATCRIIPSQSGEAVNGLKGVYLSTSAQGSEPQCIFCYDYLKATAGTSINTVSGEKTLSFIPNEENDGNFIAKLKLEFKHYNHLVNITFTDPFNDIVPDHCSRSMYLYYILPNGEKAMSAVAYSRNTAGNIPTHAIIPAGSKLTNAKLIVTDSSSNETVYDIIANTPISCPEGSSCTVTISNLTDTPQMTAGQCQQGWLKEKASVSEGYDLYVSNAQDLITLASMVNRGDGSKENIAAREAKVLQIADIDLSEVKDWQPIGRYLSYFRGLYNGNGYIIRGLKMTYGYDTSGLFGYIGANSVLVNIHLRDFFISMNSGLAGCLAGVAMDGSGTPTISFCSAEGKITSTGRYVGGLVADVYGAHITFSSFSGNLTCTPSDQFISAGGLVGTSGGGVIAACCAMADINTSPTTYATCGGLVGHNNLFVYASYAIGSITTPGSDSGSLIGYNSYSPDFVNYCYTQVTGDDVKPGAENDGWDDSTCTAGTPTAATVLEVVTNVKKPDGTPPTSHSFQDVQIVYPDNVLKTDGSVNVQKIRMDVKTQPIWLTSNTSLPYLNYDYRVTE